MSYLSMATAIQGDVPQIARKQAQIALSEALTKIYNDRSWSFQTAFSGWLPGKVLLNAGTYTVTPYSPTIIADATATAAIAAMTGRPFITELQYRDPQRMFYSIVGYDTTTNAPFATLTLDRPWMEPTSGAGQPYMIYQALFVVPVSNFRQFNAMWNTTTAQPMNFSQKSQLDLAVSYPQRLVFGDPYYAISWGADTRPGSSTAGYRMYELFPHVLNLEPVSFEYEYDGPLLVNPTDTVPYPLTEELLKWRGKECLYDWCEANKGKHKELQETNWEYLSGKAHAQYEENLSKITAVDANLRTDLIVQTPLTGGYYGQPYSTRTGGVNIGSYPLGE